MNNRDFVKLDTELYNLMAKFMPSRAQNIMADQPDLYHQVRNFCIKVIDQYDEEGKPDMKCPHR